MVDIPSHILPSNASPLRETRFDDTIPKGILEERCGNRQIEHLGNRDPSLHLKYDLSCPVENQGHAALEVEGGFKTTSDNPENDNAWVERGAVCLLRRMNKFERYRSYRNKQPEKGELRTKEPKIWPDNVEFAFWKALVKYRPMGKGKKQTDLESELRGRNELIAESILRWTGALRKRKQISSHIQVLRAYIVEDPNGVKDPFLLQFFPLKVSEKRPRQPRSHSAQMRKPENSRSMQQTASDSLPVRSLLPPAELHGDALATPQLVPYKFAMFVHEQGQHAQQQSRLHTFAQFNEQSRCRDLSMAEFRLWEDRFPMLRDLSDSHAAALQIILVEASIDLMIGTTPGAELGIEFDIYGEVDLTRHHGAPCNTYFFDSNSLAEQGFIVGKVRCKDMWMNAPFGSAFWAQKVTYLGSLLREAMHRRKMKDGEDSETAAIGREIALRYEDRVRDELERLSAVQEIFTVTPRSQRPQRAMLIFWRFQQRVPGDQNTTRWYNVLTRPLVSRTEHPNSSFNAMSAITIGADPTHVLPQPAQPDAFVADYTVPVMSRDYLNISQPTGLGEVGNETYAPERAEYDGDGDGMDIVMESIPDDGVLEQYQCSQTTAQSHTPTYDVENLCSIAATGSNPQPSDAFDEKNVAAYAGLASYDGQMHSTDADTSHVGLEEASYEHQTGHNYALEALFTTPSRQWPAWNFLGPSIHPVRGLGNNASPDELITRTAKGKDSQSELEQWEIVSSTSLQEK